MRAVCFPVARCEWRGCISEPCQISALTPKNAPKSRLRLTNSSRFRWIRAFWCKRVAHQHRYDLDCSRYADRCVAQGRRSGCWRIVRGGAGTAGIRQYAGSETQRNAGFGATATRQVGETVRRYQRQPERHGDAGKTTCYAVEHRSNHEKLGRDHGKPAATDAKRAGGNSSRFPGNRSNFCAT